jgi:hypothetical protein
MRLAKWQKDSKSVKQCFRIWYILHKRIYQSKLAVDSFSVFSVTQKTGNTSRRKTKCRGLLLVVVVEWWGNPNQGGSGARDRQAGREER